MYREQRGSANSPLPLTSPGNGSPESPKCQSLIFINGSVAIFIPPGRRRKVRVAGGKQRMEVQVGFCNSGYLQGPSSKLALLL